MAKTKRSWLDASDAYTEALAGEAFSPSASVGEFLAAGDLEPLPQGAGTEEREEFTRCVLQAASATVCTWTKDETHATTRMGTTNNPALVVSAAAIMERASDPSAAIDYATGRLLTAASQRRYMTARERNHIRRAVWRYTAARHDGRGIPAFYVQEYAVAHLAATVASIRGRELVLKEWPGWAGYFKAGDADRATPEAAAKFLADQTVPPIVRASFALGREVTTRTTMPLPPDLERMVAQGRARMKTAWKKGEYLDRAFEAVEAMIAAQEEPTPDTYKPPQGGKGATETPDSEADEMVGDYGQPDSPRAETRTRPAQVRKVETDDGDGRFRVRECPTHAKPSDLAEVKRNAAPLLDALRRIAWESDRPQEWERGQERGDLDEGALHRLLVEGSPRVFQDRPEVGRPSVAVSILVDCSGSMRCRSWDDGDVRRIDQAKAVAWAVGKVFSALPQFRVTLAGHDVLYTGRSGGVDFHTCATLDDVAGLEAHGDNADGYAIAHAIRKVATVQADRRVVILVADGFPSARGYGGNVGQKHVRSVVDSASAQGVQFLAVGVAGGIDAQGGAALFGPGRFIGLRDVRTAGPILARYLARIGKGAA